MGAVTPPALPAEMLPDYKLIRPIAAGGLAAVWLAHNADGLPRALKWLHPEYRSNATIVSMFQREAFALQHLSHPHICRCFRCDHTPGGDLYCELEYLDGVTLAAVMRQITAKETMMPLDICCEIALALCRGLSYAQEQFPGLIHRDLSPHNVMLTWQGEIKLIDFGTVWLDQPISSRTTRIWGRPAYASPEQALGEPYDARSDTFALGVMLWEMVTGKRMFPMASKDPMTSLRRIAAGRRFGYPRASAHRELLSADWSKLLSKALASVPEQRFLSMHTFGEAIAALADTLAVEVGCEAFLAGLWGNEAGDL